MESRASMPSDINYNPYDRVINNDPQPIWKRMREEVPLYYNAEYDFYALSRYKDVSSVLANFSDYSSSYGTLIETIQAVNSGKIPPFGENLGMMIFTDPPNHDIIRRLVAVRFTPKAVLEFERRVRYLCSKFFARVEGKKKFDVVDEVIRPIPPMVVGVIMGVPEDDQEYLGRLVDESMKYDPEKGPDEIEGGIRKGKDSHRLIAEYLTKLINDRRENPGDDLISMMINMDFDVGNGTKRKLEHHELLSFFMMLQSGGTETTARALAWTVVLLARHPEQRQKLLDDPAKIRNAIEEAIRYEAPSPIQARHVVKDVEWYGITIPKGSTLVLLNGSANRDADFYEDADVFDVDRKNTRHLGFGFGTHVCLGAALARLESRIVIEELLRRYPHWEIDESEMEMVCTTTVRGPAKVPISVPLSDI